MKITVIGTGYVGLVTGACLADFGNDVVCLDVDAKKIEMLNRGEIPIYEPGLAAVVDSNFKSGRLRFTTDLEMSVAHGDIQFIAVGTPPGEDGSADLAYVLKAARSIGQFMTNTKVVVNKSTVPVGTADLVKAEIDQQLKTRKVRLEYDIVSNPEFLKEGSAVSDFMKPDRVVIGSSSPRAAEIMRTLYAPTQRVQDKIIIMDVRSAELTKYASNAMLATRISFMNELARLAEKVGANIENVRTGMGSDSRIGYSFLYAGCGYGGSCFPKDIKALVKMASTHGVGSKILEAVESVNDEQKNLMADKVIEHFGPDLSSLKFAVWGLSFKPDTDDMREAPSLVVIDRLLGAGAHVAGFDPVAMPEARKAISPSSHFSFATSAYSAIEGADALILLTEWKEFRSPDFEKVKALLKTPVIFDGRNQYQGQALRSQGFSYYGIGKA